LPKKEIFFLSKNLERLKKNLLGVKYMQKLPDALVVVDPIYEKIAVSEAYSLGIPIIALADTNCNPDMIDFIIPSNDDSYKSISFLIEKIVNCYNNN
jgi:small subunit ribosomal protein S2